MFDQTLGRQARSAYEAAVNSPLPDWRAVAELFRAAMGADRVKRTANLTTTAKGNLADYNIDRIKLKCRSPRIAVRFMDGKRFLRMCHPRLESRSTSAARCA
jgi:hypothetical protein